MARQGMPNSTAQPQGLFEKGRHGTSVALRFALACASLQLRQGLSIGMLQLQGISAALRFALACASLQLRQGLSIGRDVAAARHLGGPSLCLGLERLVFFVHLVKAAADDGNRQAEHLQRYKSAAGTTCIHS